MGTALEVLSHDESKRKSELVAVVKRGMATFVEVGKALAEIRDAKLYRDSHETFAKFCDAEFQISDRRARQLIEAVHVTAVIENRNHGSENGKLPTAERQARELAKAPEEKQAEAWEQAVEDAGGEQPTAKQVAAAVEKVTEDKPKERTDGIGRPLPDYLVKTFDGLELFWKASSLVAELRDLIHELGEHPGGAYLRRELQPTGTESKLRYRWQPLETINAALKFNKPYTRCPYCQDRVKAKPPKDCKQCMGTGWTTKYSYDQHQKYGKDLA